MSIRSSSIHGIKILTNLTTLNGRHLAVVIAESDGVRFFEDFRFRFEAEWHELSGILDESELGRRTARAVPPKENVIGLTSIGS